MIALEKQGQQAASKVATTMSKVRPEAGKSALKVGVAKATIGKGAGLRQAASRLDAELASDTCRSKKLD